MMGHPNMQENVAPKYVTIGCIPFEHDCMQLCTEIVRIFVFPRTDDINGDNEGGIYQRKVGRIRLSVDICI